ncbi:MULTISPECIES: helix-turn-helix domain-containing protein [Methylobacterium]|nr:MULTISPECIES: helix-turn-helix transcriptional regulator [Methylobacterium]NGM37252.1 helix-turn-helix transcriptional regulator [Methylobacterium sp. DB0501]UHC20392.1 helix-turn-helix domain-containing protein [Methylobacterium currus]
MARVRREGDAAVSAGLLALDPAPEARPSSAQAGASDESRIAFGKFVHLMRRHRGFSMEQLAEAAELEASELLVIEADVHYVPEPRTVFRLAQTFDVSQRRLMQLAGLSAANDAGFREEAVRFAARSEAVEKLTPDESSALEAFVAVLSEQELKRVK